jgi:hypothetical protein
MCLLCVEISKERMTSSEARRALGELINTAEDLKARDHYLDLMHAVEDEDELKRLAQEGAQSK